MNEMYDGENVRDDCECENEWEMWVI